MNDSVFKIKGKKVLLQYSGGKDSTACLIFLKNSGYYVEAIHFVHRFCYKLPTEEATRICKHYNIAITIIDITEEIKKIFLNDFGGRPCRFCKAIMDKITVDFAKQNDFEIICTGDTKSDSTLVNRISEKNKMLSKYFNARVELPKSIYIYRPMINFDNDEVSQYLKDNSISIQRVNDTGDKYFEYSREGCPLQFKDMGVPYTKDLMDKLKSYNEICSEFATLSGIRAAIHLPSEFIVTIPKGYEDKCREYLVDHGCVLKPNKVELESYVYKCGFSINSYLEILENEYFKLAMTRLLERLGENNISIINYSDYYRFCGANIKIDAFVDIFNLNITGIICSKVFVNEHSIKNLILEIFHTYDFRLSYINSENEWKILIEKVNNIRYILGGCRGKWFIRSGTLKNLDACNARKLVDMGVSNVVDLRTTAFPSMERVLLSNDIRYHKFKFESFEISKNADFYNRILISYNALLNQPGVIKNVFETLASAEGVTIVCCHNGRDRTGLIVVLLGLLSGCEKETIIEDYILSYWNNQVKERYSYCEYYKVMNDFIDGFTKKYTSAEAYLQSAGVGIMYIKMLKIKLSCRLCV